MVSLAIRKDRKRIPRNCRWIQGRFVSGRDKIRLRDDRTCSLARLWDIVEEKCWSIQGVADSPCSPFPLSSPTAAYVVSSFFTQAVLTSCTFSS